MQTKYGEDGNCFAACVASLLEVSIDEVPWLKEPENWEDYSLRLNNYLKEIDIGHTHTAKIIS